MIRRVRIRVRRVRVRRVRGVLKVGEKVYPYL
jgi:hypothetical protein